jgi:hypothetical protein
MLNELCRLHLTWSLDRDTWFIGLKNAVDGVTPENAVWKTEGINNSITEILAHLNYYNNAFLQRFKGFEYEFEIDSNVDTFKVLESWESQVLNMQEILDKWRQQISDSDEAYLEQLSPPKNRWKWHEVVGGLALHNAHHAGQIILIRRLQGSWDKTW